MVGDETLDLVDCNGFVNASAGAFCFAALIADTAADCGEGVLGLDKLKSVGVSALSRQLQISLNGNMSGAGDLAGSCTGGQNILAVFTVIGVKRFLYKDSVGDLNIVGRSGVVGAA